MDQNIKPVSAEDIFLWADGTQCYRDSHEKGNWDWMSDDYEVVPVGSERWKQLEEAS